MKPDSLPLAGITILDLTRVLAGPYCTRLLCDLGARVIKIERQGDGDDMRRNYLQLEPGRGDQSSYFTRVNVGKESGAAVHVEHIISTGGTFDMAASLARIDKARDEGHDVTACMYPYNYWATYIQSPRFSAGWQERFPLVYEASPDGGHLGPPFPGARGERTRDPIPVLSAEA